MYERTFVCGSPLSHLLSLCVGLCQGVSVCVPRPAAGPEAPAPAELCVSGYPGSPLASRTSEHTVSGSPSSKQQSPSPSTKTHTHKNGWTERGVLLPQKETQSAMCVFVSVLTLSSSTVKVWSQACSPTVLQAVCPTTVLSSFSTVLTSAAHTHTHKHTIHR